MKFERSSGILLHITSLPGRYGIGTLGPEAEDFAELLGKAGMSYWQILPIGPVEASLGYSPYASSSAFAGNWLIISIEKLAEEKWFSGIDIPDPVEDGGFVSFEEVTAIKLPLLASACDGFFSRATTGERERFEIFSRDGASWLDDFALFTALAKRTGTANWLEWERDISTRDPKTMAGLRRELANEIRFQKFLQFVFFSQWEDFRRGCRERGISIIGDIPIYITLESADAWSNPEILDLDAATGAPRAVAGVPPDYFSETGQRWGNPLYRWMKGTSLAPHTIEWWAQRIAHLRTLVDVIRIDHFRGFEAYWSIPAKEKTAVRGKWLKGPGVRFFEKLKSITGDLDLIAEDLGVITPEVEALRDGLGLPGMRILQFAFDHNNRNYYLPHNIDNRNCVLYTGTHDNNTVNGWFYGDEINGDTRRYVLEYLGLSDWSDFHWSMIRLAYRSVAGLVIVPAQDIMGYGEEFRMNRPGTTEGNWRWKLTGGAIGDDIVMKLRRMGKMYRRLPGDA